MLDDLILIVASVGTATSAAALLRRRARRTRVSWPSFAGAGARQLADALCPAAAEPLPVAGHAWKSLAETLEPCMCHRLGRVAHGASRALDAGRLGSLRVS